MSAAHGAWPWSRRSRLARAVSRFWFATACSKSMKRVTGKPSERLVSRPWSNGPMVTVRGPWDRVSPIKR